MDTEEGAKTLRFGRQRQLDGRKRKREVGGAAVALEVADKREEDTQGDGESYEL